MVNVASSFLPTPTLGARPPVLLNETTITDMTRIISLLVLSAIFTTCEKDDIGPDQSPEILIYNTSFEDQSSLEEDEWMGTYSLVADASPDGGDSCLALEPQWLPGVGAATIELNLPALSESYQLSFWSKTINWTGSFSIYARSGEEELVLVESSLSAEEWTLSSYEFSLNMLDVESIIITFSAGGTEVATGQVLVDELVLIMN